MPRVTPGQNEPRSPPAQPLAAGVAVAERWAEEQQTGSSGATMGASRVGSSSPASSSAPPDPCHREIGRPSSLPRTIAPLRLPPAWHCPQGSHTPQLRSASSFEGRTLGRVPQTQRYPSWGMEMGPYELPLQTQALPSPD